MAESIALAVLENLVPMSRQDFPTGYMDTAAILPPDIRIATAQDVRLSSGLKEMSPQSLGAWWIEKQASAVLEVASVMVPHEHNHLINPAHPDFDAIRTEPTALFHFDPRLFP